MRAAAEAVLLVERGSSSLGEHGAVTEAAEAVLDDDGPAEKAVLVEHGALYLEVHVICITEVFCL